MRRATDCRAGLKGVRYASVNAITHQASLGLPWSKCGFEKEHVIPAGVVHASVREVLGASDTPNTAVMNKSVEIELAHLPASVLEQFRAHPRALMVARIVDELTLHAWVTKPEHIKLKDSGLGARMPADWTSENDKFARYKKCEIEVRSI